MKIKKWNLIKSINLKVKLIEIHLNFIVKISKVFFKMFSDVINDSALSINANEFVPCAAVSDGGFDTIKHSSMDVLESQPGPEPYFSAEHSHQNRESHGIEQYVQSLITAEPPSHTIEDTTPHQQTENDVALVQVTESEPSQSVITSSINDDKEAVANAAAAVAVAAVTGAAAAVGIAKAATASPKTAKPTIDPAKKVSKFNKQKIKLNSISI